MNLQSVYNRAVWLVYGDSTPPTSLGTNMQAVTEGILANFHRKIQEDFNYWFMEEEHGAALSAYTNTLTLPSNFKHECGTVRALLFDDTYDTGSAACSATTAVTGTSTAWDTDWSMKKHQITWDDATYYTILAVSSTTALTLESTGPTQAAAAYTIRKCSGAVNLSKLPRGYEDSEHYDIGGKQSYPLYYDIYENVMHFFPMPDEDIYIEFKYYKYLDRPTVFATHEDDLTDEASDLLVYMMAEQEELRRQNYEAAQVWAGKASEELANLKRKHFQRTAANFKLPYIDV